MFDIILKFGGDEKYYLYCGPRNNTFIQEFHIDKNHYH